MLINIHLTDNRLSRFVTIFISEQIGAQASLLICVCIFFLIARPPARLKTEVI